MTIAIDTLEFAERFESVGFAHGQAKALAAAFGLAHEAARDDLITRSYLDVRFAQQEARMAEMETRLVKSMAGSETLLIKAIGESSKEATGRLWSAIVVIAGLSTAISAGVASIASHFLH